MAGCPGRMGISSFSDRTLNIFFPVKGYRFLFQYLIGKGIMRDSEFQKERILLIERMIGFSNTWLNDSFIYERKIDKDYIKNQTNNLLTMMYTYLTASGKDQYRKLVPGLFK
jgi:hypothetical protein